MADSNATYVRQVLVDLPDYPEAEVTFRLESHFAAAGDEGFPVKTYTLALDASGLGTQELPVPDNTGALSWLWKVTTPDGQSYKATLAYGSAITLTAWLASALSTVTPNSIADQFAAIEHDHVEADITDLGAYALAADLTAHTGDTNNPHAVTAEQADALPEDAAINAQIGAYTLLAGDAGKVIECDGTFTVTLPNGLDTGFQCTVVNVGAGVITLAATTTLQSAGGAVTLAQYKAAVVYHRGGNVWLAIGGLE